MHLFLLTGFGNAMNQLYYWKLWPWNFFIHSKHSEISVDFIFVWKKKKALFKWIFLSAIREKRKCVKKISVGILPGRDLWTLMHSSLIELFVTLLQNVLHFFLLSNCWVLLNCHFVCCENKFFFLFSSPRTIFIHIFLYRWYFL